MERLLALSLRYRFFTLVGIILVLAAGVWSMFHLAIDAMPDLTPVQVQVLTRSPALGPVEATHHLSHRSVARRITTAPRIAFSLTVRAFRGDSDIR